MVGSLAFLLLALLACMALALGVIAFFAIDAVRDGRRFLNESGERIVSQAMATSQEALGKGRERLGTMVRRGEEPEARQAAGSPEPARDPEGTEALGAAIKEGRARAAQRPDWGGK